MLKDELRNFAEAVLAKRLERLKGRFVLFPWLRARMLMHKYFVIQKFLG